MVRYKHRYFLVEAERSRSVENLTIDINPLEATEDDIAKEIKNIVQDLHGDFGRASISSGFRVKYLNIATRVFLIRSRHGGPDKIISSSLPFIHNIRKENVVCRLLYTGATMRKSFIYLEKRQKRRLGELVNLLRNKGKYNKEELEKSILEMQRACTLCVSTLCASKNVFRPKCSSYLSTSSIIFNNGSSMQVFDRQAKLLQTERSARNPELDSFDFLKEEIGYRHLTEHSIGRLTAIDLSESLLKTAPDPPDVPVEKLVMDVDGTDLPFQDNSVDIVTSSLSLHWVNDLPKLFKEINRILKPDGVFIGGMFGGDTLVELRVALQLAETEREGGFSPHISPFVEVRDIGSILNKNNFTMITIDTDDLKVKYASIFPLMRDLKGMAENNAAYNRKLHLHRETLFAANAIYTDLYANPDGSLPASFQVYYWIGWKPDPSQPKPLKPQKSDVSLKDLHRLDEVAQAYGIVDLPKEDK